MKTKLFLGKHMLVAGLAVGATYGCTNSLGDHKMKGSIAENPKPLLEISCTKGDSNATRVNFTATSLSNLATALTQFGKDSMYDYSAIRVIINNNHTEHAQKCFTEVIKHFNEAKEGKDIRSPKDSGDLIIRFCIAFSEKVSWTCAEPLDLHDANILYFYFENTPPSFRLILGGKEYKNPIHEKIIHAPTINVYGHNNIWYDRTLCPIFRTATLEIGQDKIENCNKENLKSASLHFLLHLNEDFDDDLLQDAIELLH